MLYPCELGRHLPTHPLSPTGGCRWATASPGKPGPRYRPELLPSVVFAEQVRTVPTRVHKVTHGRETCTEPRTAVRAHTQRHGDTQGTSTCAHRDSRGAERCVHTNGGAVRTRATLEPRPAQASSPRPLPTSPAGRLPCQVQYHAPNKSQLIRTLPLNRSPPLGCDQISVWGRKRKPPALSSDSCCATAPRRGAACGPAAPAPPLNHVRITGR